MKLLKWLHKFLKLGVTPQLNSSEKRDVIFTNQVIFFLLCGAVFISIVENIAGCFYRSLVPAISFFFILTATYSQIKKKYQLSKILALFFPFMGAILSTILFGPLAKTQFYLGGTLILGLVLFQGLKKQTIVFFIHLFSIACIQVWVIKHEPLFENQDSFYLGVFNLLFLSLCVFTTLAQFTNNYHRYEEKINELLHSVQLQSSELQLQNNQIELQKNRLVEINDSLHKEMAEKEEMQKKLMSSNEELERFAYVASHDLKEPLRTIGSFTQILQRHLEPKSSPEIKEYFYFVVDGVKRMSYLLDDLLALSRLNREFNIRSINLNNIIEVINLNLRDLIIKKDGQLIVGKLPIIIGNKTQITQLFQNLISNAFKFKGEQPAIVKISCEENDSHFQFKIQDNGIGISPKFQKQIFIIFKRLHTRDKYEGTGIGLAICKKVVENHGGKIWLESEEGVGTTMFFTIQKQNKELMDTEKQRELVDVN